MTTTVTWLCPGCEASTVQDTSPGICPGCRQRTMVLWNIAEARETVPPISIGGPWPLARWIEDRVDVRGACACLLCAVDFRSLDVQAFVALIFQTFPTGTFCIGAACAACATAALEQGTSRPATVTDMTAAREPQTLDGHPPGESRWAT